MHLQEHRGADAGGRALAPDCSERAYQAIPKVSNLVQTPITLRARFRRGSARQIRDRPEGL